MTTALLQSLQRLTTHDPRPDRALLQAFVQHREEAAFTEVVRRYGPLVYGVCRRMLRPSAEADDAFQAVFLVLVQQAARGPWRGPLGPWLYGVAVRVALKARTRRTTRTTHEGRAAMTIEPTFTPPPPDDSAAVLDEELAQLPDAFRQALVLCDLHGLSRSAAATQLGIAEGTLSSRLARGKKLLLARLQQRGFTLPAVGVVLVPWSLTQATATHAGAYLQGTGTVPALILALTEGMIPAMKTKLLLALAMTIAIVGVGVYADGPTPAKSPTPPAKNTPAQAAPPPKPNDPVAIIYDNVELSRQQFADYLIAKYAAKELPAFVNREILNRAAENRRITITAAMLQEAIDADCKALGVTVEQFEREVLKPRFQTTMQEWTADVVQPRLQLAALSQQQVQKVTEDELRLAFAHRHGEKRRCRFVLLKDQAPKGKEPVAKKDYFPTVRAETVPLAGTADPFVVTLANVADPLADAKVQRLHAAIAQLKPGDISDELDTPGGKALFLCEKVIPATNAQFADERATLLRDLLKQKMELASVQLYNELRVQAKPKLLLEIKPAPIQPQPTPTK